MPNGKPIMPMSKNVGAFMPRNVSVRGFTLIELLVVLTILALLLSLASPRYFNSVDKAKEAALKQELSTVREAIDKYYADHGVYPETLDTLVESKYLNKKPRDPIADSSENWLVTAPEPPLEGGVFDVHSSANGNAKDGTKYEDW